MMKTIKNIHALDFFALTQVYEGSLDADGKKHYRQLSEYEQRRRAEEDFYEYLLGTFFVDKKNTMFVWEDRARYVSALRLERFKDGYLLTGLETMPSERRKGFAKKLLQEVVDYLREHNSKILYSHVEKSNHASLAVHKFAGFEVFANNAVYLDGSVTDSAYTLRLSL